MTMQRFTRTVAALATVFGALAMAQALVAADPASIASRMETFTHPDGANYFSLSLSPTGTVPADGPRDVVVMINTSASQVGDARTKSLEALKGILAGLGPQDRVKLYRVDVKPVPLTKEFVAPSGKEIDAAMTQLEAVTPLGVTDMKKALTAASEGFQADSKNARSLVYVGDGRSPAAFLTPDDLDTITAKLASKHVSVSSFVVGDRVDAKILGALAGRTGGVMVEDKADLAGTNVGEQMAEAVKGAVLWPTKVTWPAEWTDIFPKQAPPLRYDRDSVVVGKFEGKGPFEVQYEVETPEGAIPATLTVAAPEAAGDTNSYLASLVKWTENDNAVPLIGSASLNQAKALGVLGVKNMIELAKQALADRNFDSAEKIADKLLQQDPNNADAMNVKDTAGKMREGKIAEYIPDSKKSSRTPDSLPPKGGATDLELVGPQTPIDDPTAGAFLDNVEHRTTVITQQMQAEVRSTIDDARGKVAGDPRQATNELRLLLEKIRNVADINPDTRDQLIGQLQNALQDTQRRQTEYDRLQLQAQEKIATAKDLQKSIDNQLAAQTKVKQLMNRFNSLMNEGRYNTAEMQSAVEAEKLMPKDPGIQAAKLWARDNDYFNENMKQREARQKGVVDCLASVEASHTPFDDREPIIYPDADFWRRISDKDNPESRISKYSSMDLSKPNSAENDIQQALKEPTKMDFTETPLSEAIDFLKQYHKRKHQQFEIVLDKKNLEEMGVTPDSPVTMKLDGISLRSALRLMLKDLGLTYMIKDEVLYITTPEIADANLTTKVYPVADLVIPVNSGMGMMGGMGGMMGGMGGMGGGMGGMMGGMGGMGGGMGGMGGGMGGMGMFNVPRELIPKTNPGGLKSFSVKDDLSVPAKADAQKSPTSEKTTPATEQKDKPATVAPAKFQKIGFDFKDNDQPSVVWEKYFSANTPEPAAVRDAVRRLMENGKYDHVIELIGAALRHRQQQSWMYEAMSLAMQAAGRPQEDIERAILSTVDFVQTPTDLMYIAAHLFSLGYNERALDVCRQVAVIDPTRSDSYLLGIKAARQMKDLAGLRWASLGILNQAWSKNDASVWQAGVGVAEEVLKQLEKEKRTEELASFRAALDKAVERDCVVVVNYTGNAQLDLSVLEPTGSVCSYRMPRTASGGLLLGDDVAQTNTDNGGGKSEVYVCPKGFEGNYRIVIQRVFGNVATGKVHVKVITHYLGKNSVAIEKSIPLVKDAVQVAFELRDGRRKEPISDMQIANAAETQMKINAGVQVLAQQIEGAVNPAVLGALANSNSTSGGSGGVGGVGGGGLGGWPDFPFARGGVVGYQPRITTLPSGASLGATAVISADRRYVRVSPSPVFSGIGEVHTFNTFTGDTGTSSGGNNSSGFSGTGSGLGSGF